MPVDDLVERAAEGANASRKSSFSDITHTCWCVERNVLQNFPEINCALQGTKTSKICESEPHAAFTHNFYRVYKNFSSNGSTWREHACGDSTGSGSRYWIPQLGDDRRVAESCVVLYQMLRFSSSGTFYCTTCSSRAVIQIKYCPVSMLACTGLYVVVTVFL